MLFFLILIVPAVLLFLLLSASLLTGSDRSGAPGPVVKRSDAQAKEDEYSSDDDDIAQLRAIVGKPRHDRHTDMPATFSAGSPLGLDAVELEELVELTNSDRRRQGLPPLARDEILRRFAG